MIARAVIALTLLGIVAAVLIAADVPMRNLALLLGHLP